MEGQCSKAPRIDADDRDPTEAELQQLMSVNPISPRLKKVNLFIQWNKIFELKL
jgi:hypothetical protein